MKIKASKADLETALRVADIGIAGSGADLSTHYLFRVREGAVEVLSFNQRICASVPLKCEHEGEDSDAFTVEGWRLNKWLGGVGDVAVEIRQTSQSEVQVGDPKGSIDLASLDPAKFPFWDKTFTEAKSVTSLPSERLSSAFNYAKNFISDNDTTRPEISQVEVLDGSLWATDKKAVTLISLEGLDEAGLRVHGKDIPSVTKFLGLKETESVEVLEHDRAVFFRRPDGALLGASRPVAQFPTLKVAKDGDDAIRWEINKEELLRGIQRLSAAADRDNTRLKFSFDKVSGKIVLGVKSVSGKENTFDIECVEQDNAETLPDEGFWLDYPYITHIVGHFGGDTVKFGINQRGKGGYVRFHHSSGDDDFLTVVVWRI
jgi:hypothetical protein